MNARNGKRRSQKCTLNNVAMMVNVDMSMDENSHKYPHITCSIRQYGTWVHLKLLPSNMA
jgi:hypothetical protein